MFVLACGLCTGVSAQSVYKDSRINAFGRVFEAPKQVADKGHFDKAQLSRWESGAEGVCWPKLVTLMDVCGNDAPVLWQLHQRGFDLASVRRRESELERQLRSMTEERDALKRVLLGAR